MNEIKGERCPVSGLKIIKSPEWEDIEFNKGYSVSYMLIGDSIIHGKGEGKSTLKGLVGSLGLGQKIIEKYFGNRPFVYIENFEKIINPSAEARKYYINFMKSLKNMKALIYYNVTPYMSFNIRLAKKLNILSYPVFVVKNYEEAVKLAINILNTKDKNIIYDKNTKLKIISKPEWNLRFKESSLRLEVIEDIIFHSIPEGKITTEFLDKTRHVRESILREYFSDKKGKFYFVVNYGKLHTTTAAKKKYIREINDFYSQYQFKTYFAYKVSKPMKVVLSLSSALVKFPLKIENDFDSVFDAISSEEKTITKKINLKSLLKLSKKRKTKDDIQKYVDEFLRFLGEIDWEEIGISEKYKKDPSHPFYQIYEAIAVIKNDLDELYLQKEKNEEEKNILAKRLEQSLKLEAIGKLAGAVAHDLNNVLMGIVSYPDYVLKILPDDEEHKKAREYIKKIKESGIRAANIVQDLLTLSGKGVKSIKILNLNSIIEEYINSPEFKELKEKYPKVKVKVSLDDDLHNISGSKIHLYKTIMNLVKNGFEAIEKKGKVLIMTKNTKLKNKKFKDYESAVSGDFIELTISDDGSGISEKDLPKIFEPFYSKKRMGRSGTGLGMMVVKNTVEDHNGFIEVKSKVGKGTEFKLYFPAEKQSIKEEIKPKSDSYLGNGESILVVDDEEEQRIIASDILKSLYYKVKTASSGEEAIELIKNENFDLILLDMIMASGMGGLETYKKIREIKPEQKTIIISGYSASNHVLEAQKLGVKKYIRKPYTIETISKAVYELLNEE